MKVTGYKVIVHYMIDRTVNVDRFTCSEYECDRKAGVLRLVDGHDKDGPVWTVQYDTTFRVLSRPLYGPPQTDLHLPLPPL